MKRFLISGWRMSASLMPKMKCWHCSSSSCRLAYFHSVVACCFKKYLFTNRRNSSVYKGVKTQRINPLSFKCPRKGTKMLMFIYIYLQQWITFLDTFIIPSFTALFIETIIILPHQILDRRGKNKPWTVSQHLHWRSFVCI